MRYVNGVIALILFGLAVWSFTDEEYAKAAAYFAWSACMRLHVLRPEEQPQPKEP
jgi:hypothetical protein